MKMGAVPYWSCGGEVLTRALDANGRLVARPVAADEVRGLIAFYDTRAEAAALTDALNATVKWSRAAATYA